MDAPQKFPKDFLPTCNIYQGTMFPILPDVCTCGKPIGTYQREIESAIGNKIEELKHENLSYCETLSRARVETFKSTETYIKELEMLENKSHSNKYKEIISNAKNQIIERTGNNNVLTNVDDKNLMNLDVFTEMGFTRDCCLLTLTTYPFLTVNDIEGVDAFVDSSKNSFIGKADREDDEDDTIKQINENVYVPNTIKNYVGAEFYPLTLNKFGFDQDLYCEHLYELTLRTSKRHMPLEGIKTISNVPRFANLGAAREAYPVITIDENKT